MAHSLPPLPYPADGLEPFYDKATLEIHHGKHHAAYVEKLNQALSKHAGLKDLPVEDLLAGIDAVPPEIRSKVINNGGGHANHSLFWTLMSPHGGGKPTGGMGEALQAAFGDFEAFRRKFTESAMDHFGSGWTFLVEDPSGSLSIRNYPNQDSPVSDGLKPILLVDLWEHAYYLKWQNRKAEWLESWWNIVDWDQAARLHAEMPRWMAAQAG